MLAVGGAALWNANGTTPANSPVQAAVSAPSSGATNVSSSQQAQIQQLQSLISQYQAREQQYQTREQQYKQQLDQASSQVAQAQQQMQEIKSLLSALQQRGIITITADGQILINR